jgi:hypothetical protein
MKRLSRNLLFTGHGLSLNGLVRLTSTGGAGFGGKGRDGAASGGRQGGGRGKLVA